MSRDIAESGEAREEVAACVGDGVEAASRINCERGGISGAVSSKWAKGTGGPAGDEHYNLVCLNDTGGQWMDVSQDVAPTLRAEVHNHPPCVVTEEEIKVNFEQTSDRITINPKTSVTLKATGGGGGAKTGLYLLPFGPGGNNEVSHAIRAQASKADKPDSTTYIVEPTYCLQGSMIGREDKNGPQGTGINEDVSFTLNTTDRHAVAQPIAFNGRQDPVSGPVTGALDTCHPQAQCIVYPDPANTLLSKANLSYRGDADTVVTSPYIAGLDCRNRKENGDLCGTLQAKPNGGFSYNCTHPVRIGYRVRRLTPTECLRLQGLPDDWLDIEGASDSAKYKAVGNGMAKPCPDFIFSQIVKVLSSSR